jgi:SAM-dependent methyltransferase
VLDIGCGTGEHAMLAAERGADALGVDVSPLAISPAADRARARGNSARFAVGDALNLAALGETFDVAIDSGLFHVFEHDAERLRYADSLAGVLRPDGTLFITCISAEQTGSWGPDRVTEGELRQAFRDDWVVEGLRSCTREVNRPEVQTWSAEAWLATIRRRGRVPAA